MAESWVQVAADGAGKRIRNILLAAFTAGQDVYQQVVTVAKSDGTLIEDLSRSSVTQPVSAVSLPLPTGASTEATLGLVATQVTAAQIKAKTDNLDVAISTLLKAADTLTKVGTVDTITNPVAVTGTFYQSTQPVSDSTLDSIAGIDGALAPVRVALLGGYNHGYVQAIKTDGQGAIRTRPPVDGRALLTKRKGVLKKRCLTQ